VLRRRSGRRAALGISLIEIAVTLSVMALLMSLAVPSFQELLLNGKVRSTADAISKGLQRARTEAVKRNQSIRFTLVASADSRLLDDSCQASAEGAHWVVSVDEPSRNCAGAPSAVNPPRVIEKSEGTVGPGAAVAGQDASGDPASSITFNGFGRPTGGLPLARIDVSQVSGAGRSLRVTVSSSGAVRLCDPAVRDAVDPRRCL